MAAQRSANNKTVFLLLPSRFYFCSGFVKIAHRLVTMVENFEGVLKKEWCREDLKVLTSQIKEHESLLRLKRRWLMDLPLSISEHKRVEETLPPEDKMLPESLLREDDVSYEDIRTCIEIGFGAHDYSKEPHCLEEDLQVFDSRYGLQDIYFLLDDMTNKGLYSFVKILTGG
ncbi:UNVERIFIED_CONTAM: hypothetical protein Slati_4140800 [Sesamum latifolium]|uniref:Uncharacterized protein n=1 Tax=Sesamum latifolium TaxID=2727402 RepID=A0AAW2T8P8_9LAMI